MKLILLVHAAGEESRAEPVAEMLISAGYEVLYEGSVLVGESLTEEISKALEAGSPVVLCGTIAAAGTRWTHQIVNAARRSNSHVFTLQMDRSAHLELLSLDGHIAAYWNDEHKALNELLQALLKYYPLGPAIERNSYSDQLVRHYRNLALKTYDIIDLANLPVVDRNIATRELLLRSLYVALRIDIETAPESSNSRITPNAVKPEHGLVLSKDGQPKDAERWSVGKLLANSRKLVVLGDPGAGKSTLLRWIATAYCLRFNADPDWQQLPDIAELPDEDWLPILIQCRDLEKPQSAQSLEQILDRHLRKLGIAGIEAEKLNEQLLRRLSEGRALLLIDGLDEITQSATRVSFCRQIEQMHVAYSRAPIIATSRIVGYREMNFRIGRGFEHVNILDLTADDKDEFARRWCIVTEPVAKRENATRELIRDIHSTDRIERLTGNPMLLTTMALVKKKVGKLPSKRADLYREAVDVLLNWRSDVDEQLDPYEALPQLEYLAYAMCASGKQRLRSDEVIELLNDMRSEYPSIRDTRKHSPLQFLRLLERRTGILVEIGRIGHRGELVPVYEFRHLTFQEYLASLALVKGRFPGRNKGSSLAENVLPLATQISRLPTGKDNNNDDVAISEDWSEVLRLCVMSCDDDAVDDLLLAIAGIYNNEQLSINHRARVMLAVACLSDEPNVSQDVAVTLIDSFIGMLRETERTVGLVDGRTIGGSIAGRLLADIGRSCWGPELTRHLVMTWLSAPEHDSLLGACAAQAGGQLAPDDDQEMRTWLMQKIRQLSSPDRIERICAALSIMEVAFESRSKFRNLESAVIPAPPAELIKMLNKKGREAEAGAWALSWFVRDEDNKGAIWKLSAEQESDISARITNPQTTTLTAQFLTLSLTRDHSTDTMLAEVIARNLVRANKYHISPLVKCYARLFPTYVKPIIPMTTNPSPLVRAAGVRLLGQLKAIGAIERLLTLLSDKDGQVQKDVISVLGDLGDARAVEPLISVLVEPDSQLNEDAAMALGQLGDARAVEPLISALVRPDGLVSEAAAYALGELKDARGVEPLISALVRPDGQLNEDAATALGQLGDARAVEPLISALVRPDGQLNEDAAMALGQLGDARAVEPLISALVRPDGQLNEDAAMALGQLGDARAVEPLISALVRPDGLVSEAAAYALGELKDARAVEPLISALVRPDGLGSDTAAYTLGELKDARAVEPLISALVKPVGRVSDAAAYALGELKDARAVEPLISALVKPDGQVSEAAATALGRLGDARAVEHLIAVWEEKNLNAPSGVVAALATLGNGPALQSFKSLMESTSPAMRQAALWKLARCEQSDCDRILLSRDADGMSPGLDTEKEIGLKETERYARAANLSIEEVCGRYKQLQRKYPLKLSW